MSKLRFRLEGAKDSLGEHVSVADFGDFIDALRSCFRQLERESGPEAPISYRVSGLEIGSAVLELDVRSPGDSERSAAALSEAFEQGFNALEAGTLGSLPFERRTQEAFVGLMKPLRKDTRRIEFVGQTTHALGRADAAQEVPEKRREASVSGTVSGKVERVNVHGEAVFFIYPASGPSRIKCRFDPSLLLDDLREAIARHTIVHGLIEFEEGEPFPVEVTVAKVEAQPPDAELPTLASLWGSAPDLTGGLGSVEYVRGLRDVEA